MSTYWFLLLVPAFSLFSGRNLSDRSQKFVWILVWVELSLIVGFRHEVGGDWFNYINRFSVYDKQSINEVLGRGDPFYHLISWVVANLGGSIHWVNFVCAMIVASGIVRFVRSLPLPWLALFMMLCSKQLSNCLRR